MAIESPDPTEPQVEPLLDRPPLLDLDQFESLEDACAKAEPGDRYLNISRPLAEAPGQVPLTMMVFFWQSMITRAAGLHGAAVREIRCENPHAVFPLIRAFTESVVMGLYVYDHPRYVNAVVDEPRNLHQAGVKRKSISALITHVSPQAEGLKAIYAELSEATHFGSIAMWAAHRPEGSDGETATVSWTSYPRWRDDRQAMIACAQVLELADAMEDVLQNFFSRYIAPTIRA